MLQPLQVLEDREQAAWSRVTQPLLTSQLARQALPSAPARPSRRSSWFLLLAVGALKEIHAYFDKDFLQDSRAGAGKAPGLENQVV